MVGFHGRLALGTGRELNTNKCIMRATHITFCSRSSFLWYWHDSSIGNSGLAISSPRRWTPALTLLTVSVFVDHSEVAGRFSLRSRQSIWKGASLDQSSTHYPTAALSEVLGYHSKTDGSTHLSVITPQKGRTSGEIMTLVPQPALPNFHSFVNISRSALRENVGAIRSKIGPFCELAVPVKSNAYGHGVSQVVSAIDDLVDRYLVDDSRELATLRTITQKPIELLGYVSPAELPTIFEAHGVISLFDEAHALACLSWSRDHGKTLRAYLAIDLRFGREGISIAEAPGLIRRLRHSEGIELLGIYGHFSSADDDHALAVSHEQYNLLKSVINEARCDDLECHLFASSGIWKFDTLAPFDRVVRPGLSVYGLWPARGVQTHAERLGYHLTPALSWHSTIAQVKAIPAHFPVGYGQSFRSEHPMVIGLVPQGYGDGIPRAYQQGGWVLVEGTRRAIIGRISMNMLVVDLSEDTSENLSNRGNEAGRIRPGTPVLIIGSQGDEAITPYDHATITNTVPYEVVTRICPLLPRLLVD